jgi:hypothetical protein
MENKLILPKPHLSYSQMACWLSNPTRYRKEYFECGDKLDTKYLRFGSGIHKMIEDGTYKELLPDLIVYDKNEFEVRCEINGIPTLSYIDSYDSVNNVFRDTKTGKIPWTRARAIKLGQLVFYATVLKKLTGKMPKYCDLDWIETKEHTKESTVDFWRDNEKELNVTGRVVSFHREFDEREIEKMEELIVKVANEISDAYQEFLKEI